MTHSPLNGFYTHTGACRADPTTGERACWIPRDDSKFGGCACPAATQFTSPLSTYFFLAGVPGDVSGDHHTSIDDLLGVIERWNQPCPRPCIYDHDDDGLIEVGDLLNVINHWGTNWN